MRSRDSAAAARLPAETLARVAALALLAISLWRSLASFAGAAEPRVHAELGDGVTSVQRDSLAALSRAGFDVTWSGALRPVAAMAEPVREPAAGWRISVAADSTAVLTDQLGALDSLGMGGGAVRAAGVRGLLSVREGTTTASIDAPADISLGRVLVLSRAGWEAKFVIAALEEQGWDVDARLRLGEAISVTQGNTGAVNLARHAAVVVLDTAVGRDAAAITRFVRAGGGLVLAGEGAGAPSLQSIAPARVARIEPPETRSFGGHEPTHALPLHALGSLRPEGTVIESREGTPALAARRVGAGRVVQMGYAETWRWRMQGEGRSVDEHRAFWSRVVGAAAAVKVTATDAAPEPEAAASASAQERHASASPLAQTVHALGAPIAAAPSGVAREQGPALPPWVGALLLALLVGEWASRRTRGAA